MQTYDLIDKEKSDEMTIKLVSIICGYDYALDETERMRNAMNLNEDPFDVEWSYIYSNYFHFVKNRSLYAETGINPYRGVFITGEHGCGRHTLMRRIVNSFVELASSNYSETNVEPMLLFFDGDLLNGFDIYHVMQAVESLESDLEIPYCIVFDNMSSCLYSSYLFYYFNLVYGDSIFWIIIDDNDYLPSWLKCNVVYTYFDLPNEDKRLQLFESDSKLRNIIKNEGIDILTEKSKDLSYLQINQLKDIIKLQSISKKRFSGIDTQYFDYTEEVLEKFVNLVKKQKTNKTIPVFQSCEKKYISDGYRETMAGNEMKAEKKKRSPSESFALHEANAKRIKNQ